MNDIQFISAPTPIERRAVVVHEGGLGDTCCAESTFLSIRSQYSSHITAIGNSKYLNLFPQYFDEIKDISEGIVLPVNCLAIVIAKSKLYREMNLGFFVESFSDKQIGDETVEGYQLRQLAQYNIEAQRKEIIPNIKKRVFLNLCPSTSLKKMWEEDRFYKLADMLSSKGINSSFIFPEMDLTDIKDMFLSGGVFVSNDSGLAHLAGAMGVYTVCMFNSEFMPPMWRTRGVGVQYASDTIPSVEEVALHIEGII